MSEEEKIEDGKETGENEANEDSGKEARFHKKKSVKIVSRVLAATIALTGAFFGGFFVHKATLPDGIDSLLWAKKRIQSDYYTDISNEDLLGQYERMLDIIADKSPRTKVYIQSALPVDESRGESLKGKNVRIAEFNALLQKAAAARGLQYIDIWSSMAENGQLPEKYHFDGIHLKADGYKVWIDKIRPYVK